MCNHFTLGNGNKKSAGHNHRWHTIFRSTLLNVNIVHLVVTTTYAANNIFEKNAIVECNERAWFASPIYLWIIFLMLAADVGICGKVNVLKTKYRVGFLHYGFYLYENMQLSLMGGSLIFVLILSSARDMCLSYFTLFLVEMR